MASRRPLSARNVDKNHGTTIVKKKRYPFVILNRQALAESVRQVVKEAHISPAVTFSEEDILKPTVSSVTHRGVAVMGLCETVKLCLLKER